MKHFNLKKCGMDGRCWSGFSCVLGVVFIVVATILTLLTMNGFGIFGMFVVGIMLCRHNHERRVCPCCEKMHEEVDEEGVALHKPKAKAKKETVKK